MVSNFMFLAQISLKTKYEGLKICQALTKISYLTIRGLPLSPLCPLSGKHAMGMHLHSEVGETFLAQRVSDFDLVQESTHGHYLEVWSLLDFTFKPSTTP